MKKHRSQLINSIRCNPQEVQFETASIKHNNEKAKRPRKEGKKGKSDGIPLAETSYTAGLWYSWISAWHEEYPHHGIQWQTMNAWLNFQSLTCDLASTAQDRKLPIPQGSENMKVRPRPLHSSTNCNVCAPHAANGHHTVQGYIARSGQWLL